MKYVEYNIRMQKMLKDEEKKRKAKRVRQENESVDAGKHISQEEKTYDPERGNIRLTW